MKRVVVAGFYRTGSTWLFNAVKTVIKQGGYSTNQTGGLPLVTGDCDYMIHKVHGFSEELRDNSEFIFVSTRDRKKSLESFERCFGHPINPVEEFAARKASADWIIVKRSRVIAFNQIKENKRSVLANISRTLRIQIDIEETLKVLEEIKPPEYGQDADSLYFSGHITSNEADNTNTSSQH